MNILRSFALALCSTLVISCASAPRMAHFAAPSSVGVRESAKAIQVKIDSAQTHAAKAKAAIQTAIKDAPKIPELRAALDLANGEIDSLSAELLVAKSDAEVLQTRVDTLDKGIQAMTKTANDAIDQNNKLISENSVLKAAVSKWRGLAIKLIVAISLVVIGALAWIFRKPILMALGGAMGGL